MGLMYLPAGHALMNCNDQGMAGIKSSVVMATSRNVAVLQGKIRASNDKHCPMLAESKLELYGT